MVSHLTGGTWPHYVGLDAEYPSAFRLSWSGRALDRQLLAGLDWGDWERVIESLMTRVAPEVVHDAVRRLPDSYYELVGAWMTETLQRRRSEIPRIAREFYELLSSEVDIHATDEEELARIERISDGSVRVSVHELDDGQLEPPYFERTFVPSETREIRLDLRGDDDRIEILGATEGPIRIRVDGGGSDDLIIDETSGGGVFLYSDAGDDVFRPANRTTRRPEGVGGPCRLR